MWAFLRRIVYYLLHKNNDFFRSFQNNNIRSNFYISWHCVWLHTILLSFRHEWYTCNSCIIRTLIENQNTYDYNMLLELQFPKMQHRINHHCVICFSRLFDILHIFTQSINAYYFNKNDLSYSKRFPVEFGP